MGTQEPTDPIDERLERLRQATEPLEPEPDFLPHTRQAIRELRERGHAAPLALALAGLARPALLFGGLAAALALALAIAQTRHPDAGLAEAGVLLMVAR